MALDFCSGPYFFDIFGIEYVQWILNKFSMRYSVITTLFLSGLLTFGLYAHGAVVTDTIYNQTDNLGLKQGHWKKHYKNGIVAYKGFFKDDKPRGEFLRYHENGRISARMNFTACGDTSYTTLYSAEGYELSEGVFLNTKKHGKWQYFAKGKRVVYTEEYNNGLKHGAFIIYYPDGQVYETVLWKDGEKHGISEQFYPEGTPKSKILYRDGLEDGPVLTYYRNGEVRIKGQYAKGLKEGVWQIFLPDREGITRVEYHKGIAANHDELVERETRELDELLKNKGKITDPDIEDFIRAGAY